MLQHNTDFVVIISNELKGVNLLRIGICETDSEYLSYLSQLLSQIRSIHGAKIIPSPNPKWLISDLSFHSEAFDILLIHREMSEEDGTYVAREAVRMNPACQVVLISDNNCILDEDYDIMNLFLLPKELVPSRLVTVIDKAVGIIQKQNEHYFYVRSNREKLFLPCSAVFYMEKVLRKTELVTSNKRYTTYQTPVELSAIANTDAFVQCHRSYYVNLKHIHSISAYEITLWNEVHLPIGSTYSKTLLEQYEQYYTELLAKKA